MTSRFKIPESWGLSPQQELVIGSLLDDAGKYISSADFCIALYDEDTTPAPAKLRMLIQRCRDIVSENTKNRVTIVGRRNSGWKITRKGAMLFSMFLDK